LEDVCAFDEGTADPCRVNKWLCYSAPTWDPRMTQTPGIVEKQVMKQTRGKDFTEELTTGKLLVSLNSVKDVEDTVAQLAKAAVMLKKMLLGPDKWNLS
jgi:hypothetical protein